MVIVNSLKTWEKNVKFHSKKEAVKVLNNEKWNPSTVLKSGGEDADTVEF